MDGVHVKFPACPAEMSASCTGKEKVPTVGWNVTVSHTMRILYVGDAQLGAANDKTHARRDELLNKLKKDDEPFVVQSASMRNAFEFPTYFLFVLSTSVGFTRPFPTFCLPTHPVLY